MTDRPHTTVNGHRVTHVRLYVANVGPWHAELEFEDNAPELTGAATLQIGSRTLRGTLVSNGTFGLKRRARMVAGAAGWSRILPPKAYHNDAGVKGRTIAEDAARETGETLGSFLPPRERLAVDYVRQARPASGALDDVLGGSVPWWVDDEGVTHAGPRPSTPLDAALYELLAYDPQARLATLAVDDPGAVQIGSVLSERLDEPLTVRELELRVSPEELRIVAWCGGQEAFPGRLAGLVRAIVDRATDGRLWGVYRYRVLRMAGDRVELQAVHAREGLPDVLPVSMWPGVAGVHAVLAPSSEVLVQFLDGRRTEPIVTAFAGKDGVGFVPVELVLGGSTGQPVNRQGDAVEVLLPPAVFTGTVDGKPATGVMTFVTNKALGVTTAGSAVVKSA